MADTFEIPGPVMAKFVELALDVGGDLGQSQMLIEKIRDDYCLNYVVPNLWQYEYYQTKEIPQD
ncbi:MAG: hypothetical protein ACXABY_29895 [Candidatus Thorarchaeota archaeon]